MDMSKRRRLLNTIDISVKRPHTMHEQSVNEILQSDVDKMAARVKAANDADGQ